MKRTDDTKLVLKRRNASPLGADKRYVEGLETTKLFHLTASLEDAKKFNDTGELVRYVAQHSASIGLYDIVVIKRVDWEEVETY